MLATKAALASGGITHCCLRCGLRLFFLASARSCCRWRAAGLRQQLGGTPAFADQLVELGAFLRAQPHHVLLDGNLFPDHESPPSLPCGDRDSEVAVIFNDGSD